MPNCWNQLNVIHLLGLSSLFHVDCIKIRFNQTETKPSGRQNVKLSARRCERAGLRLSVDPLDSYKAAYSEPKLWITQESTGKCVCACACAWRQGRGRSPLCNFLRQSKLLQGGIIPYVRGKERGGKKELSPALCSHCNYTHDSQKYTQRPMVASHYCSVPCTWPIHCIVRPTRMNIN